MEYKKKAEELAQMLNNSQEFQELKNFTKKFIRRMKLIKIW